MTITIDLSAIAALTALLDHAAKATDDEAARAIQTITRSVHGAAAQNAASFHIDSTGELYESVDFDIVAMSGRVFSNTRQAALLEFGTPTTGPPRPWITGPAEQGSRQLLEALADTGRLW